MKVDDTLLGALFALLGAVVLWHVRGFPVIPGQQFGAALFPGVVAGGLVICGLLMSARGLRRRSAGAPLVALDAWMRDPVILLRFLSVPAGLLFYVLASDFLGFHITASLAMLAWLLLFGVRPLPALALAIAFPILMHLAFYKLLRVPLPWGLLQSVVFP
ncbi:MAG: tripartite tricarboxylate transporter TctB family protein [Pseudomonadota bacterium]